MTLAYSWAHSRGYRAAEAHYEPILAAIREEAVRAEARARAAEIASARAVERISQEYADRAKTIETRAAAVERDLARRLRDAAAAAGRCRVSEDSAAAAADHGAARERAGGAEDARADRLAAALVGLAASCERDAARLKAAQEYIRALPPR